MTPIDPPQPPGGEYPLSALVPSFIRQFPNQAAYQKVTGNAPKPYDNTQPDKLWDDTRKFTSPTNTVDYNTEVLNSAGLPVEEPLLMPAFVAASVNIPPDTGPRPPSIGSYPTPVRALLPNERPVAGEGGEINIINTDIDDPDPIATIKAGVNRLLRKVGA